jgi:hypothetical protein
MASGGKSRTRAAASSIASGSPSRREQIAATAPAASGDSRKPGSTAVARCTKRATAGEASSASGAAARPSSGTGSGRTRNSGSPESRRIALLVTISFTPWQPESSSPSAGAPSSRCSNPSSTRSTSRTPRCSITSSSLLRSPTSLRPRCRAMADGTSSASSIGSSGTNHTPSANPSAARAAARAASRVLPTPPAPVRVRRRTSLRPSSPSTCSRSPSRPISGVGSGGSAPSVRVDWRTSAPPGARSQDKPTACRPSLSSRPRGGGAALSSVDARRAGGGSIVAVTTARACAFARPRSTSSRSLGSDLVGGAGAALICPPGW